MGGPIGRMAKGHLGQILTPTHVDLTWDPQICASDFAGADHSSPIGELPCGKVNSPYSKLQCNQPQPCAGYGSGQLTYLFQLGLGPKFHWISFHIIQVFTCLCFCKLTIACDTTLMDRSSASALLLAQLILPAMACQIAGLYIIVLKSCRHVT